MVTFKDKADFSGSQASRFFAGNFELRDSGIACDGDLELLSGRHFEFEVDSFCGAFHPFLIDFLFFELNNLAPLFLGYSSEISSV